MSAAPIFDPTPALKLLVSRVDEMAVLPHVVFKVLEISGSEDTAASEMERAIIVDPGFSARLLTHANSSYYALSRKVSSVKEAIVYLGFKSVREMAMTIGVFDMFVGRTDKDSLRRRQWWRHSIDTAVCCRYIANHTRRLSPDEAYTCGLLHYIGKTILDRFGEKDYEIVEKRVHVGLGEMAAEQAVFGCDHEQVAVAVAQKWGLPLNIQAGLIYTQRAAGNDGICGACVALGDAIANLAVEGPLPEDARLPAWAIQTLGIAEDEVKEMCANGIKAIADAGQMHF